MLSFFFIAGIICAIAAIVLLLPWLRTIPRFASLPALPWQAGIFALVALAAMLAVSANLIHSKQLVAAETSGDSAPLSADTGSGADQTWGEVAAAANQGLGVLAAAAPQSGSGAQSMQAAIASLQSRLSKDGGSAEDWELLAKSYEFEGRPDAATRARAHQIPTVPTAEIGATDSTDAVRSGTPSAAVNGEVTLAAALRSHVPAGAILFIIAKALDPPGAPVAVIRTTVGSWPQKFMLDDSRAMLPAHNLSSAGRITIEARISQNGQALAARGDLQGISAVINPRDSGVVKIVIDKVVP